MPKRKKDEMESDTLHDNKSDDSAFERSSESNAMPTAGDASGNNTPQFDDAVINLDVRGTCLRVLRSTLATGPPDSLLARLFGTDGGPWTRRPQADGSYFIDDDPQDFDAVLCYLRYGTEGVRFESATRAWRARALATYYMLDDMAHACFIQALTADLNTAPTHAVATLRYVFQDSTAVTDTSTGFFGNGGKRTEAHVGLFADYDESDSPTAAVYAPATIHYVRTWSLMHLLAWIAHSISVPMDGLEFFGVEWHKSSWTGDVPHPLGGDRPIDVDACAARLLTSFAWTRAERGGLIIQRRDKATGTEEKPAAL
ncbi:BTB incomplete domain containing protein [Pandoravirus macleodensis]|uniref:BTB incomplete domain containing protein n=1 Tax=Pandoravirus macleodensis TaxID=2107707 RepID=A0A2U7UFK9_9VIRU|nr:BTB incomplete domain containing protein [Pandoravirus macleodensis]AVK77236.1 BTB incomplete domain containing protein [Pandoravirus macleodensis]